MISINEAIALIEQNKELTNSISLDIERSLDYVLAENIYCPINMPPFNQSAMDGFAINYNKNVNEYRIIGTLQAGKDPSTFQLKKGEAIRIFTGAAVPESCTSVIQQEWCDFNSKTLSFNKKIANNLNIRPSGEQQKKNMLVLEKGALICAPSIGLLAGIGISKIKVFEKPRIGIVITGDELVPLKSKLTPGKIFESNSYLLNAALNQYRYSSVTTYKVEDDFVATKNIVDKALSENSIVLVSGGISVGDYDYVYKAISEIGVNDVFYKINQKPGKPLYFGKLNTKAIFGLPGNPGSALTCFYIYVLPYLSQLNQRDSPIKKVSVCLEKEYTKKIGRGEFLKAVVSNGKARICKDQNSSMLTAFIAANALLYIPGELETVGKDRTLTAYLLL